MANSTRSEKKEKKQKEIKKILREKKLAEALKRNIKLRKINQTKS